MTITINATGTERKRLVQTISDWTGCPAKYCGARSFDYRVDYFTIHKDGSLSFDDSADSEVIEKLLQHIYDEGFDIDQSHTEEELPKEEEIKPQDETVGLTVAVPLDKVAVGNLTNLLDAKGALIKKALGIPATPIEISEDRISFPWFTDGLNADEVKAYSHFIAALCEMSRTQKRINATEKAMDNEKYAFRCFLLRLGFIGNEYKTERKILLRNLSGSSAFKAPKTEKDYRVELDDDNFKIFSAKDTTEAERIGADIAEKLGSGYCLVKEVAE